MSMKTEPFLGGKWGWDLGENNWKDGADENFLKFSYMLNGNVDGFVSSLPGSPLNGTAYFLTSDTTLNARIDGVWYKFPTPLGFVVTEKATGAKYEFNGSAFVATLNSADKTKLNAVASGATANSTDADLRDRSTHTCTQAISTITSLQTSLDAKAPLASPTFTGAPTAPTAISSDNSTKVATTAFVKAQGYMAAGDEMVTSVAGKTGDVTLTKADVGLNNVDNTADTAKPVSTAQQTALDLKAPIASPTFTGTVVLPSSTSIGSVSATEVSYLAGITSSIQGQINSLSGASGAYAPINNPTFTGTVGGITKSMVGLGNVDNTSDVSKPVSTAQQTAINLKLNAASPTFTSNLTFGTAGAKIIGDFGFTVSTRNYFQSSGLNTATVVEARPNGTSRQTRFQVSNNSDPTNASYLEMGANQTSMSLVTGFNGSGVHLPLVVNVGGYTVFNAAIDGTVTLPSTTIIGNVSATELSYLDGVTSSIQTQLAGKQAALGYTPVNQAGDTVTGTLAANLFSGSGASLTSLNASNISSGTISASRLPFTLNQSPSSSTVVQRDGAGSIFVTDSNSTGAVTAGTSLNGASLNIVGTNPVTVIKDTNSLVGAMTGYTSYQDSTGVEVAWIGFGAGNGEMGFNNSTRNLRFLSPVITNSSVSVSGTFTVTGGVSSFYNASTGDVLSLNNGGTYGKILCSLAGTAKGSMYWDSSVIGFLDSTGTPRLTVSTSGVSLIGTITLPSTTDIGSVSSTELSYLDGVTSSIQTQLNAKQANLGYTPVNKAGDTMSGTLTAPVLYATTQVYAGGTGSTTPNYSSGNVYIECAANNHPSISFHSLGIFGGVLKMTNGANFSFFGADGSTAAGVTALSFSGSGASLTSLNAGNISSGTVADARLSSNVALVANVVTRATPSQTTQSITHSSAGTLTINLANGTDVQVNVSANITALAFTNAPSSSEAWSVTLEFIVSGTRTIAWPSGTKSAGGTLPTLTAGGTDVFVLRKRAADNYMVFTSGKAMA